MSEHKAPRGVFAAQLVDALRKTAHVVQASIEADMVTSLDWPTIRNYLDETIDAAMVEDAGLDEWNHAARRLKNDAEILADLERKIAKS